MTVAEKITPADKFELHLSIPDNGRTAIDHLADNCDLSRQKLKQIMHSGAVWLSQGRQTRRLRRASSKLTAGQILHLYFNAQIQAQTDFDARLIADEGDYSVWYKPAGMLSQGSKYGDHGTIYRWAETHLQPQRNAFLVHRLDKATSGLMLLAHSKNAARSLAKAFSERRIGKFYKAMVHGVPAPQLIDIPLADKPASTRILASEADVSGRYSLLDIQLLTGRKHQIRQHLSALGYPLVGDRLYGHSNCAIDRQYNLGLTAYKLSFISPFDQQAKHYELGPEYFPPFPQKL